VNLASGLALSEHATLLIDLDPQANASSAFGISTPARHLYDALMGDATLRDVTQATELPCLHVVPSGPDLVGAEIELVGLEARERQLARCLEPALRAYDFVLIDCPPSLGLLTLNALTAADSVLIPLQCEYYALEGLARLLDTVDRVSKGLNPRLVVEGIVLTMVDLRANLTRQVWAEVRQHFPDRVYDTTIPRNVRLSEAPSHGKPALLYDVHSKGAISSLQLAEELLKRTGSTTRTPPPRLG
jgi:chromosome partitioning protein